ncbi:GNAT family N-acetyltransferase [Acidipropionibacterium thoenii]|uniref:GNAT family N-acetyltransferase n=1 Tax=Acidipropionibacterium thoenii TaxID=1751 RepID=UPI000417F271|nr:GNAT family N-acetyltransferase [Acidipropionibacterium thoenii]
MTLRSAGPEDLDQVMAVERACFGDFEAGQRAAWSRQSWQADLDPGAASRLVLIEEGPEGPRAVADFGHLIDCCDLDRIMVIPQARRTGVAARLLEHGMTWAARRGARQILLEVRPDNLAALALYRSHGFDQIARRNHYYGTGEDALVMSASLESCAEDTTSTAGSNEERHV